MTIDQGYERRPLIFIVESFNSTHDPEQNKIIVQSPIAGSFKVTNGKFLAVVTINELGVEVKAFDSQGNEERLSTKKLSL